MVIMILDPWLLLAQRIWCARRWDQRSWSGSTLIRECHGAYVCSEMLCATVFPPHSGRNIYRFQPCIPCTDTARTFYERRTDVAAARTWSNMHRICTDSHGRTRTHGGCTDVARTFHGARINICTRWIVRLMEYQNRGLSLVYNRPNHVYKRSLTFHPPYHKNPDIDASILLRNCFITDN